jgi:intein-encoded DNA endonuclease-like protein
VYLAGTEDDWQFDAQTSSYQNINASIALAQRVKVTVSNVEAIKYYKADSAPTTHTRLDLSA